MNKILCAVYLLALLPTMAWADGDQANVATNEVLDALWEPILEHNGASACELAENVQKICNPQIPLDACTERLSGAIANCRAILTKFYSQELPYQKPISENSWYDPLVKAATICPAVVVAGCGFQMTEEGHQVIPRSPSNDS